MAPDNSHSQEVDLDRTDILPILEGTLIDDDVADDAVRLDYAPAIPSVKSEFSRPSAVDLPSLKQNLRSVEERIARQNVEYEALSRSYEKARDAEAAAASRAEVLAADLTALRTALESEQARSRGMDKALAEKVAAAEAARDRMEAALRDAERQQSEARTLRTTLAARDATIVQVLHSLGERDAQLSALQREHAQIVPSLEERSTLAIELEAELRTARARSESMAAELDAARQSAATQSARLKAGEAELGSMRRELSGTKALADSYLERLRTREYRRGLDENVFRELDSRIGAAQDDRGALQSERQELRRRLIELEANLALRDAALADALAARSGDAERSKELLAAAQQAQAALTTEMQQLRSEAQERDEQMEVLMAHLQEARRPIEPITTEIKRLSDELAARTATIEQLNEENRTLRAALERTSGALEEREFLIRRLERSESENANALGRIQTSIERLGSPGGGGASVPLEYAAELVRIDADQPTAYTLGRRTRIGRAPGCDMLIESSSVSRHHALVLVGSRDVVIEDLNSTNGVLVNGHKVMRQQLKDGDILTIGEAHFRVNLKLAPRVLDGPTTDPR